MISHEKLCVTATGELVPYSDPRGVAIFCSKGSEVEGDRAERLQDYLDAQDKAKVEAEAKVAAAAKAKADADAKVKAETKAKADAEAAAKAKAEEVKAAA